MISHVSAKDQLSHGGGGEHSTTKNRKKKKQQQKNLQPDKLIVDILNLEAV